MRSSSNLDQPLKPYQRLGITDRMVATAPKIGGYERMLMNVRQIGIHASARAMFLARDPARIAICLYLSEETPSVETWHYGRLAIRNTIEEFFFHEWRNEPNKPGGPPRETPYRGNWIEEYRFALMWACVLDDWNGAKRLSEYPQEGDDRDQSERKSEAPWYLLLAELLTASNVTEALADVNTAADAPLPSPEPPVPNGIWLTPTWQWKSPTFEELVEHVSKKRIKLLATALRDVIRGNERAARTSFESYMAHFRKSESKLDIAPGDKISVDGTILFHLARRAGMALPISKSNDDIIIRMRRNLEWTTTSDD